MADTHNFFDGQKMSFEKRQAMKKAINTVFKSSDPFGEMFHDWVKQKMLLSPDGYYLDKRQFGALIKTIKKLEETSFYLSRIEGSDLSDIYDKETSFYVYDVKEDGIVKNYDAEYFDDPHNELSVQVSYEEYRNHELSHLDNALYSTKGTWGIIISHEDFAVIGGTDEFMTLFQQFYSYADNDLKNVLKIWGYDNEDYRANMPWIHKFLKYVNAPIEKYQQRLAIDNQEWQQIKQTFLKVFKDADISEQVFSDAIQEKTLLYSTNSFYLNETQFLALMKTIKMAGETSFYVSRLDESTTEAVFGTGGKQDDHFELSCDISYEDYQEKVIFVGYALYSTKGTWGILVSQEGGITVSVIGGSHDFIALFKQHYKEWDEDIKKLIAVCKYNKEHYNSDVSWLPDLLKYVGYSDEKKD